MASLHSHRKYVRSRRGPELNCSLYRHGIFARGVFAFRRGYVEIFYEGVMKTCLNIVEWIYLESQLVYSCNVLYLTAIVVLTIYNIFDIMFL